MIVTLENPVLRVSVEDAGAQLCSVRRPDGTEYIWQADPAVWGRHAPLLFPIIGRLKDGRYRLGEKTWTIPTHGFGRDSVFTVGERGEDRVTFTLTHSPKTRAVYPFAFSLAVTYRLEGDRLIKSHRVENLGGEEMLYELGGHDGYRCPLSPGETMGDYAVVLPGVDTLTPYGMNEENMLTPKGPAYPLEGGRIALTPATYGLDTVILDDLPQRKAMLVDGTGRARVTVDFADFPYLGLWTADKPFDTNYVCIEPWSTLPDGVFLGRDLGDKPGIRRLAPGAAETLTYTTTFH